MGPVTFALIFLLFSFPFSHFRPQKIHYDISLHVLAARASFSRGMAAVLPNVLCFSSPRMAVLRVGREREKNVIDNKIENTIIA